MSFHPPLLVLVLTDHPQLREIPACSVVSQGLQQSGTVCDGCCHHNELQTYEAEMRNLRPQQVMNCLANAFIINKYTCMLNRSRGASFPVYLFLNDSERFWQAQFDSIVKVYCFESRPEMWCLEYSVPLSLPRNRRAEISEYVQPPRNITKIIRWASVLILASPPLLPAEQNAEGMES